MPEPISVPDRDGKIQCAHDPRDSHRLLAVSHVLLLKAGGLQWLRHHFRMFYNNFTRVNI